MERQSRLLTILSLVLLVLVALVVYGKDPKDKGGDDDEPPSSPWFDGKKDDVERLTLKNPKGESTFEKKDGAWQMTAPRALPIEDSKVTEVLDRVSGVEVQERDLGADLARYGLDPAARAELTLTMADGKSATLYVGKDTPVGYRSYVATAADGPALVGSTRISELAQRGPDDFRSPVVWKASAATAKRIRIEDGDRTVVLRKDDHGWWLGDDGPRAGEAAVDEWLGKAEALRVASFLDDADPANLGLTTPSGRLVVEDGGGTHELRLGARAGEGVAAQADGAPVRLANDALELLKVDGWADSRLLPVRKWQLDAIEVQLGDKARRFTRMDGSWQDADGKPAEVDALLDAIDGATADRATVGVAAPASAWGRIVLAEGETRKESLVLGPTGPEGSHAAKEDAGGPPFLVPQATIEAIAAKLP